MDLMRQDATHKGLNDKDSKSEACHAHSSIMLASASGGIIFLLVVEESRTLQQY